MILRLLCAALLAASPVVGQVVHLANHGSRPWAGWSRFNVDVEPPADAGWRLSSNPPMQAGTPITAGGRSGQIEVQYVKGSRAGLDTWHIDLWCSLAPGQKLDLSLATLTAHDRPVPPAIRPTPFGGTPIVRGSRLVPIRIGANGAGVDCHFRARVPNTRMLWMDLWFTWYPDQPWVCGEVRVTCSNPLVPDVTETITNDIVLEFGDAIVTALGQMAPGRIVAAGTKFGDGQSRACPVTFLWLRQVQTNQQFDSWMMDNTRAIGAVGIAKLWPLGNPRYPQGFAPLGWAQGQWERWTQDLHQWASTAGPSPNSAVAGEQGFDQVFVRGESMLAGGAGAEIGAYLGGLAFAKRPCHHLEPDGRPLDPALHPALRLWDGHVHNVANSPDRIGKVNGPASQDDTSGWYGPDVEHGFCNTLAAGCRLRGSPCLQAIFRSQATVYRLQQTLPPGSNGAAFASRAIGWEYMRAVQLWRDLEDRDEAERVRAHSMWRWNLVTKPAIQQLWWGDGFKDQGLASPWQMAVGAFGVWLWGREFGVQEAQDIAMDAARTVLQYGCYQDLTGRWKCWSTIRRSDSAPDPALYAALDPNADPNSWTFNLGGSLMVATTGSNTFWLFGTPMAAWLCRNEPRGAVVWAQMQADATEPKHYAWFPPTGP